MKYHSALRKIKRRQGERGSALVAVLCLIFLGGMLAASVASLSMLNTVDVASHVNLQRSFYINEGVMNRVQFFIAADRYVNGTKPLMGDIDYTEYEYDRFLPDGVIHEVDYYGTLVRVRVYDAISGWDFAGNVYRSTLDGFIADIDTEQNTIDLVENLKVRIADYIDTDDTVTTTGSARASSVDSMEKDEYESGGLAPLPRNAALEYREELFFIKDFTSLFPPDVRGRLSSIRLIPPPSTVRLNGTPSFFSATPDMLMQKADLEEDELAQVLEARDKLRRERIQISDILDSTLLSRLQSNMSWRASDYYTVIVDAPPGTGRPSYRLCASFGAFSVDGAQDEIQEYLEWIFY